MLLVGALTLLAVVASAAAPEDVRAHAEVVRSRPGNGDQLLTAPGQVVIDYSEGVQLIQTTVVDGNGQRVDAAAGQVRPDARSVAEIALQPGLPDGIYTVRWQALADDGHTTRGAFFFVVGPEPLTRDRFLHLLSESEAGQGESGFNPLESAARGFLFLSLMILVGAPLTVVLVMSPAMRRSGAVAVSNVSPAVHRLLVGAIVLFLVSATLLAATQAAAQGVSVWEFASATSLGGAWLVRLALGGALLAALLVLRVTAVHWLGAVVIGAAAQLTLSATSHTASYVQGPLSVMSDLGHLAGGAIWGGGLCVLGFLLPGVLRELKDETAVRCTAWMIRRFSAVALTGVPLAVALGLLLAAWHVPTWDSVFSTLYGSALAAKAALVLLALGLGGVNRLVMLHRITRDSTVGSGTGNPEAIPVFVSSVRLEFLAVVAVLVLSGILTSAATASVAAAQHAARQPLELVGEVRDIDVVLRVRPHQVGLNVFDVSFSRGGQTLHDVRDAALLVRLPEQQVQLPQVRLEAAEPGLFSALASFTLPGRWEVRASAEVEGRFTARRFDLAVVAEKTIEPDPAVANALRLAALAVGLLGSLALAYELYRYRSAGE